MTSIILFLKYVTERQPYFRDWQKSVEGPTDYLYCSGECTSCHILKECNELVGGDLPTIHTTNMKEFKDEYPEYFI